MPKIKGWEKKNLNSSDLEWKHDHKKSESRLQVFFKAKNHSNVNKGVWKVVVGRTKRDRQRGQVLRTNKHLGSFKTKEKARKRAITWMKNHPNGLSLKGARAVKEIRTLDEIRDDN